jgi:hypothetical protein
MDESDSTCPNDRLRQERVAHNWRRNYLQLYQTHRSALLARRGAQWTNYPDSVATTWSLSFQFCSSKAGGGCRGYTEEVGFEPTKAIHLTRFPVVLTRPL